MLHSVQTAACGHLEVELHTDRSVGEPELVRLSFLVLQEEPLGVFQAVDHGGISREDRTVQ